MSSQMVTFGLTLQSYMRGETPAAYASEANKALALDLLKTIPPDTHPELIAKFAATRIVRSQQNDLKDFDVTFDTWLRESDLHSSFNSTLRRLHISGLLPMTFNGLDVCGECGFEITYRQPCGFCTQRTDYRTDATLPKADDYESWRRRLSQVHPDNDFVGGPPDIEGSR